MSRLGGLSTAATRSLGTPQWDAVLRGTGIVSLLAIYPAMQWPEVGALAAYLCITIFVNGPLAPLLPAAYEPIQIIMGRVYSPLLVALIGVGGTCYIEFINYYLYRWAISAPRLERVRNSRLVRVTVAVFRTSPFLSVFLCALTPLPYWAVRFLAPLSGYPVRPYLVATFLGRAPRYYVLALFGELLPVSTLALAAITVVMIGIAVAIAAVRSRVATRAEPAAPADLAGDLERAHD